MVGTAVEMQKTVYTFSGVVTDAETKAPIKGVEVYVSDPASGAGVATGTTDENGERSRSSSNSLAHTTFCSRQRATTWFLMKKFRLRATSTQQ